MHFGDLMIPDQFTRIVTKDGRYGYDSVSAAVQSLPRVASGGQQRFSGTVFVGPGCFVETDLPIPVSSEVHIRGSGSSGIDGNGTIIQMGSAGHLFAPEDGFTDWGHHLTFEDLMLDGGTITGDYDLLRILKGGFNTALRNVVFRRAPRVGLRLLDNAVNCFLYNCSAVDCVGPAVYVNLAPGNLCTFGVYGFQADNCGNNDDGVFLFDNNANGDAKNVIFSGIETEANNANQHDKVIVYRQTGGNNPIWFTVTGVSAWRNPGGATAIFYDEDGPGMRPRGVFQNLHGSGYLKAMDGDGFTSAGNHLGLALLRMDLEEA